jgi:hypothetical protein
VVHAGRRLRDLKLVVRFYHGQRGASSLAEVHAVERFCVSGTRAHRSHRDGDLLFDHHGDMARASGQQHACCGRARESVSVSVLACGDTARASGLEDDICSLQE